MRAPKMLQKLYLIFIYIGLFNSNLNAQNFKGEVIGGLAGSQISGDQLSHFKKGGLIFGLGIHYDINDHSQAGFRMKFIQKGSRKPTNFEKQDTRYYLLRLNYIEVPVFYHFNVYKSIYLEISPSLAYLASSSEEDENGDLPYPIPFNTFDLSIGGCIGYPITNKFNFQFGYSQSILPVREPKFATNTTYLNRGQYNSVIAFEFLYNLKRKK